jgi:hypothetical protein|tara:strand:+ start:40616 stop:41323 length:708 start_codon:yes stop_codon:yes gene_type:complete
MQHSKDTVNLHKINQLDKSKKAIQSQADCIDSLKGALDVTLALTAHYLEEHIFDYCVITNTISELTTYITTASQREADILIKKMNNLFDAAPKNKSVIKQMPLKRLLDSAKERLWDCDAYKINDKKTANYDFMVNMLKMERTLAKADHPFIILSLNAENLFTGLLALWRTAPEDAYKYAQDIGEMLKKNKEESPFFEVVYTQTAFICLEALCFDIHSNSIQKNYASALISKAVRC